MDVWCVIWGVFVNKFIYPAMKLVTFTSVFHIRETFVNRLVWQIDANLNASACVCNLPAERLINAIYLPALKLEMHNLLIERTVAECMFSRHSTVLMSLLKADSTDTNIIDRHLNELHNRWTAISLLALPNLSKMVMILSIYSLLVT